MTKEPESPEPELPQGGEPHSSGIAGDSLSAALARHGIELPIEQVTALEEYCRVLWETNQRLNLTRHTDYETFVARDLVDSMQLAAMLRPGERVLDVGSGGGVPGIVLAILRSDVHVSLAESVGKKARALAEMIERLKLPVPVFEARAEHLLDDLGFDTLVARAVGPLWKICQWFAPHWESIGRMLVIKGPAWVKERGEARHRGMLRTLELRKAASYTPPGADAPSVILELWPKGRPRAGGEPQV